MHLYTTNELSRSRLSKVRALQTDTQIDVTERIFAFTGGNELCPWLRTFCFIYLFFYSFTIYLFTNNYLFIYHKFAHKVHIKNRNEQGENNNKKGKCEHLEFLSVTTSVPLRCVHNQLSFSTQLYCLLLTVALQHSFSSCLYCCLFCSIQFCLPTLFLVFLSSV